MPNLWTKTTQMIYEAFKGPRTVDIEFNGIYEEIKIMVSQIKNISVTIHIINRLPYETKEDMLNTVKYLNKLDIQGIKIHMLCITKDTPIEKLFKNNKFKLLSKEEYIDIVIEQLEYLRPEIVIHRLTADPKISDLIEPKWITKKFTVLDDIDKEMVKRDTYQGAKL